LDPYEGDFVVEIDGGEHHSIARTKMGAVYCWGRNDEGQIGIGDTFGDYRKKKAKEDAEKAMKEEDERVQAEKEAAEKKAAGLDEKPAE
jgi:alpha-tubulin suppressor-like RCC1 family protein